MDIMAQYLHMDKQVLVKLLQWKAVLNNTTNGVWNQGNAT